MQCVSVLYVASCSLTAWKKITINFNQRASIFITDHRNDCYFDSWWTMCSTLTEIWVVEIIWNHVVLRPGRRPCMLVSHRQSPVESWHFGCFWSSTAIPAVSYLRTFPTKSCNAPGSGPLCRFSHTALAFWVPCVCASRCSSVWV